MEFSEELVRLEAKNGKIVVCHIKQREYYSALENNLDSP